MGVAAIERAMSLNWRQFELGVLRPTLEGEPEVAIKLVGETIWHESDRLQALGQYPRFPAGIVADDNVPFGAGLGIASIEEPTWDWMDGQYKAPWHIYEKYKAVDGGVVHEYERRIDGIEYKHLVDRLALNVLACRFRYKLDKRPLPKDMLIDRAEYWLSVYNGSGVRERLAQYMGNALDIPWVQ